MQWPFILHQDGFRGNIFWFLLMVCLLLFVRAADESREDDKTLSQQIADGKYGLIDKELFSKKPKRPGIVSYAANPEVPKDSSRTLGGLQPDEIWLAEDHVLVLKGGWFPGNTTSQNSIWPPIDAYQAPPRQVKLPKRPKVPPPFPVRLRDGGPIELLGASGARPLPHYPPLQYPPFPPPFPPPAKPSLPPPPFPLPPGAVFLPPPNNQTEPLDEDDPSIYYPPPYDFSYPKDNSSNVPPGPLVPGIVLPPPPDFFGSQEENKTTNGSTSLFSSTTTPPPTTTTKISTTPIITTTTISPIISTLLPTITIPRTNPPRLRVYTTNIPTVFGSRTRPRPSSNYVPVTTDSRKKSNMRFNNNYLTTYPPTISTLIPTTTTTTTTTPLPPPLINIPYEEVLRNHRVKVTTTTTTTTTTSTTTQPPSKLSPTPPLVQVPVGHVQITNKGKSGLPKQLYYYDAPVSRPFYLEGYLLPGVLITNRTRGQQIVLELAPRPPSQPPSAPPVTTTRPLLVYYAPLETNTVAPTRGSTVRPPSKTFYFYEESSRARRPPPSVPPPPLIPPTTTVETIRATDVTDHYFRHDDDGNGYVYQTPDQPLYYTRPRPQPPPPPPPIRQDYYDNYRSISNLDAPLRYRRPTTTPRTVYEYSFQARDAVPNVYTHHSLLNDASPTASNLAAIRATQQLNTQNDYYKRQQPLRALHVTTPAPNLATDTRVNYRHPRPSFEPEAEYISPPRHKEENVIRYSLPGNHQAHVYFLTPQNQRRRQESYQEEQVEEEENIPYTRKYHHRRKQNQDTF